jgi:DNA-binding response OmpR family regulator
MARPRILVIEDDAAIRRGILAALQSSGLETLEAAGGDTGRALALNENYDLLLLDLVLPRLGGLEILRELRRIRPTQPVIILTARGTETDRLEGFRRGADDYVVKPFSLRELLARVSAVLRRSAERPLELGQMAIPGGVVCFARREVQFADGRRCDLSECECPLLYHLAANAGRALSRDELLARIWRSEPGRGASRTVDMHIARLREKLGDDAAAPRVIVTVRGKGYKLAESGACS